MNNNNKVVFVSLSEATIILLRKDGAAPIG